MIELLNKSRTNAFSKKKMADGKSELLMDSRLWLAVAECMNGIEKMTAN